MLFLLLYCSCLWQGAGRGGCPEIPNGNASTSVLNSHLIQLCFQFCNLLKKLWKTLQSVEALVQMSILMRLPEVFPECYVASKKSIKHEKPRAQTNKTCYLNACCKYSDMSLYFLIDKEFTSSILL